MREVCAGFEVELREFNGEADHVHLLVHYPAEGCPVEADQLPQGRQLRYVLAEYTGRINRIGMGSVFRSRCYFAGSCGKAPLTVIRQYIEGQRRPL